MIERIVIENFKSFRKVDLKLGQVNLLIGMNASGKSNFFDAMRVLRGIAMGLSIKDIFEGSGQTLAGDKLPGVRGGMVNAIHKTSQQPAATTARFVVEMKTGIGRLVYRIEFDRQGKTLNEELQHDGKNVFVRNGGELRGYSERNAVTYDKPLDLWKQHLLETQFLSPEPEILRDYGSASGVARMGEHGENFASVVHSICERPSEKESLLGWLREMRPEEVEDVGTLKGAVGEPMFMLRERGETFPAVVLSDGTLRFAALAASFFQENLPKLLLIEELENGIHTSRVRLLLEMVKSQAKRTGIQVIATTHSRSVLDWLEPSDYETTFYCHRGEDALESKITPLSEVPHLAEATRKNSLGDLLAENWLEAAL